MSALREPDRINIRDRHIDYRWRTPSLDSTIGRRDRFGNDPDGEVYAELSVGHDKDRKQFYAILGQVTLHEGGRVESRVIDFGASGGGVVLRESIARYSAKQRDYFAARALATLGQLFADFAPKVTAFLPDDDARLYAVGDPWESRAELDGESCYASDEDGYGCTRNAHPAVLQHVAGGTSVVRRTWQDPKH